MLEKYGNTYLFNSMDGAKHGYGICDCGQIMDNRESNCINCGSELTDSSYSLKFGSINYCSNWIFIENLDKKNKDCFRFALIFSAKQGAYNINFAKKSIYKIKKEIDNAMAIIFDAHQKKEDMIKFFNIKTQEYVSENDFVNKTSKYDYNNDFYYNYKLSYIKNKLNLSDRIKTIRPLIKKIKELAEWCLLPYNEILIKAGVNPTLLPENFINKEGTSPTSILGVKKYTFKQILKYEQSTSNFLILKKLEDELGDKSVDYMDKLVVRDNNVWLNSANKAIDLIKKADLSIEKLARYIYKEVPIQQYIYEGPNYIINLLHDSYEMATQLNIPFDKAPKALKRYHNTLAMEFDKCKDQLLSQKVAEVSKKYSHLEYKGDARKKRDYCIMVADSGEALVEEGKSMQHCVGSYIEKMAKEQCVILFLRYNDNKEKSFVTIEYIPSENAIIQIKARRNTRANKDTLDFINKWAKKNNIFIKNSY